jgi:hypothetical protein
MHKQNSRINGGLTQMSKLIGLGLMVSAQSVLAGPPPSNVAVVSTLNGGETPESPVYRVQSDALGNYVNGVSSVLSLIYSSSGDWTLDTQTGSRKIRVDLTDPVPNSGASAPFATALVSGGRIVGHSSQNFSGGFLAMRGLNSSILAPLSVRFNYAGRMYALRMNPQNHPGTDWTRYTCIEVLDPANPSTSLCKKWSAVPAGINNTESKNIAHFEDITSGKSPIAKGRFYINFDFTFSR